MSKALCGPQRWRWKEAESSSSFPGCGTSKLNLGKSWAHWDKLAIPPEEQAINKHTNKYSKFT